MSMHTKLSACGCRPVTCRGPNVTNVTAADTGAVPYGVEVTAADGKVELWGTVDSNAARKRIEITAASVVGVKAIESHLQVDSGA